AAAVVARTEGVPLYVVEVVRTLLAGGPFEMRPTAAKAQFRGSDVGGRGQTSGAIDVPPNVRLAVAYQLETLSRTRRELLALAASFGREFRFEALMRAAELDPTRILDLLGQAIAARILTEVPDKPERYRFRHALLVEALVDGWGSSVARQAALHRRGMAALAGGPPPKNPLPEVTGKAGGVETIDCPAAEHISPSREAAGVSGPAAMDCVMRCEGEYWL